MRDQTSAQGSAPESGDAARAHREMLLAQVADLEAELAEIVGSGTEVPDDEHDPEGSTIGFERARVGSLLAHARHQLVTLARRMESGSDRCGRCGRAIGDERRAALPATDRCVSCAAQGS